MSTDVEFITALCDNYKNLSQNLLAELTLTQTKNMVLQSKMKEMVEHIENLNQRLVEAESSKSSKSKKPTNRI